MHCSNCGARVQEEDLFCVECGRDLTSSRSNRQKRGSLWWVFPVLGLIVALGSLASYYFYEQQQTEAAMASFHKGEDLALKGKYTAAEDQFQEALSRRPHFPAAALNLKIAQLGNETEKTLNEAVQAKKHEKFTQALQKIETAETHLQGYSGKVIEQLDSKISEARGSTMVAKLEHDMKGKSSIEELAPLLTTAESLNTPDAGQVEAKIRKKIVAYAYAKASDYLKENQFTEALTAVKSGLLYDGGNEKLLSLQKSIEEQQSAFAKAEESRIQQAMAAAAEEQSKNEHNAVELVKVTTKMNQNGDLTVSGSVKNVAKVPISLVSVTYTLYDADGKEYATNETYVTPNTLYPGETGTFDYTHFQVGQDMTVKVNGFKWIINN